MTHPSGAMNGMSVRIATGKEDMSVTDEEEIETATKEDMEEIAAKEIVMRADGTVKVLGSAARIMAHDARETESVIGSGVIGKVREAKSRVHGTKTGTPTKSARNIPGAGNRISPKKCGFISVRAWPTA